MRFFDRDGHLTGSGFFVCIVGGVLLGAVIFWAVQALALSAERISQ